MTAKERARLLGRYRVTDGDGFRLSEHDTADCGGLDRDAAEALLEKGKGRLAELQEQLYASATWSLLVLLQAMDAAGKDGTIKHVMSGVNPQGVQVTPYKAPSPDERAHDFLWRHQRDLPRRGWIGLHNRSCYEEVLVTRVHPEVLDGQHLPAAAREQAHFWRSRLADIAAWEAYLARQGTAQIKVFLNLGRDEQRARLLARLDDPSKTWKFDPNDVIQRACWPDYMDAYQAAIRATAAPHAPWFVVPADHKWFSRLIVVWAMVDTLEGLSLSAPKPTGTELATYAEARAKLMDS